ncbi:MAG TPA: hypothetical protein PL108_12260, partial [Sediminibacterium sp.]|nr:hypothetical protein [Sediminibacterium sp.]
MLALEIFLFACNSFDNKKQEVKAPEQGFSSAEDSVEFGEDQFIIDKLSAKEKAEIFIVFKDNKSVSIKDYFEKELYFLDDYAKHNAAQFYDFDKDGENELIIFNYSGGIAGFQYDFFKKNADKSYIQVYSHHGSALDIQGNKLTIYMDEFRYFFTCGACRVELPNEIYSYFDLE